MSTFTIGGDTDATEERYEVLPIKELAFRQIVKRFRDKDWAFSTVRNLKVVETPIRERALMNGRGVIAVFDADETYSANTQTDENTVTVVIEFLLPVGEDEIPRTVLNAVRAETMAFLYGQHDLRTDDGEQTNLRFAPDRFDPDYEADPSNATVFGTLFMRMTYRTRKNMPHALF